MTIVFFWTGFSSTMAACWRALASVPQVRLVVYLELRSNPETAYQIESELQGVEVRLRHRESCPTLRQLEEELVDLRPHLCVVLGWRSPLSRMVAKSRRLRGLPRILAFDMPYAPTVRKRLAPFVLSGYLSRFAAAFVPGEAAARYARHLGFSESRIHKGLIGFDYVAYDEASQSRMSGKGYPRRFLFAGRYVTDKGLDLLLEAYASYRQQVSDPWTLTCCGIGPLTEMVRQASGVEDRGFVQPHDLCDVYAHHGVFILPSRYEPWGFVLMEAAASGLPIICTSSCGSSIELVRDLYNGLVIPPDSSGPILEGLLYCHAHESSMAEMGCRSRPFARSYATDIWIDRVLSLASRYAT